MHLSTQRAPQGGLQLCPGRAPPKPLPRDPAHCQGRPAHSHSPGPLPVDPQDCAWLATCPATPLCRGPAEASPVSESHSPRQEQGGWIPEAPVAPRQLPLGRHIPHHWPWPPRALARASSNNQGVWVPRTKEEHPRSYVPHKKSHFSTAASVSKRRERRECYLRSTGERSKEMDFLPQSQEQGSCCFIERKGHQKQKTLKINIHVERKSGERPLQGRRLP